MNVKLVFFSEKFLNLSWVWLNDDEINELTNTPKISKQAQLDWFTTLPEKIDYKIWGIEVNGEPIGACGLKNITAQNCEYWGYIGEKAYWGQGIGEIVLLSLIKKAKEYGLKTIWLKVLKTNIRAIKLYEKCGFHEIGNFDERQKKMEIKL